jgi:hypothetical protein
MGLNEFGCRSHLGMQSIYPMPLAHIHIIIKYYISQGRATPSLGFTRCRRFARGVVDSLAVSSIRLRCRRFARGVVDSLAVSSIRSRSRRFARGLVDSLAVSLIRWRCR